jgi:Protein of unknown function (DUF3800)
MGRYLLFMDESGDHGLKTIDPNFPIFVLTGLLFSEENYQVVCRKIGEFKNKYLGTAEVILHRRDMRKYERGFEILFDADVKRCFYADLNGILQDASYTIISSIINKQKHIEQYGKLADDPYEIALTFVLERTLFEADDKRDVTEIHVTIEGRGKKEDALLAKRYNELLYRGTGQVESRRLTNVYDEELEVRLKRDNDCGLQLADLCAYPIARYFLNNNEPNPAYEVIKDKIRKGPRTTLGYGIKIFP